MAKSKNIIIDQGTTFSMTVSYKTAGGVTLIGGSDTAKMQIRATKSQTGTLILDCASYLSISTTQISVSIPATITAALTTLTGYYDIELTQGSTIKRLVQGTYTLDTGVTV